MNIFFNTISTGLKAVLSQYELFIDQNTRDHLARTTGNGDPIHEVCMPHRIPRAWQQ